MWKSLMLWKTNNKKAKREIKEIEFQDIDINNCVILDVRSRKEFLEGHINNSINIPLDTLKKEINKLKKEDKIVVCCQSGIRSKKAIKILENLGFKNLYNLKGGIENIQ